MCGRFTVWILPAADMKEAAYRPTEMKYIERAVSAVATSVGADAFRHSQVVRQCDHLLIGVAHRALERAWDRARRESCAGTPRETL
jgi:hypothetical protein